MKNKLIKEFVKKSVVKTVIFTIVMCIIASIAQSLSPVVSNALALTQMQNSDEMYVLMNTYNTLRVSAGDSELRAVCSGRERSAQVSR